LKNIIPGLFLFLSLNTAALATTVQYVTPSGFTFASLPDDYSVSITTAANTITLVFDDRTSDPKTDTQGISGLALALIGTGFDPAPSIQSITGKLINVASDGTWTQDTVDSITQWEVKNTGVVAGITTIFLDVFSGGTPEDVIIGNPAADNVYTKANNSIAGSTHNPFIQRTATFVLHLVGVTGSTQVSSATFNFGTAQGLCVGGSSSQCVSAVVATPEPGTAAMFGAAILLVGIGVAKRRRATRLS
jgi:hypothetical protein